MFPMMQHKLGRTGSLWAAGERFSGMRAEQTQWQMPGGVCAPPGLNPEGRAQGGASGEAGLSQLGCADPEDTWEGGLCSLPSASSPQPHPSRTYTRGDLAECTGGLQVGWNILCAGHLGCVFPDLCPMSP